MKKAFTLIELMIAIIILSILLLAMSSVIKGLKNTRSVLSSYYNNQMEKELLVKVLYADILNASFIKIDHSKNKDYDRLYLQTSNSLYNLIHPYVLWYVSRNKNALIRVESPFKINLPNQDLFFLDKFLNDVKIFKIYRQEGKDLVIISSNKSLYFEVLDKDFGIKSKKLEKSYLKHNNNNQKVNNSFLPTF